MKKSILFSLFGGVLGMTSVMAANFDLYINGSTAFRNNAFAACSRLYDGGAPANANNGTGSPSPTDSRWTMSGTAVNLGLTTGADTLTIHAVWNGSVQGISSLGNKDALVFLKNATSGSGTLVTNTASCALSDVFSDPTLVQLSSASFTEKKVCVQPFIFVKSVAPGGVQSITNITWQQLVTLLGSSSGSVPLSYFTGKASDYPTNIYLVHRSLDSGTRVTTVQEGKYIGSISVNYYDPTSDTYIPATTNKGPAFFGPGYVAGGDVRAVLQTNTIGNQAIGYLSFADAKTITGVSWAKMLAYNGLYPIANYAPGVAPVTNDFSAICNGGYSFWAFEVLDWPKTAQWGTYTDQNLSFTQLNAIMNKLSGTGVGSIDYEILQTQTPVAGISAASAIRLSDMLVSRPAVGGVISP